MSIILDLGGLTWERFEQLTVFLAQETYKESAFEEFLKKGHNQQGIDILSFDRKIGRHFCIQCKRVVSISAGQFADIIAKFEEGKFIETAGTFLVASSADLQFPELRKEIENQRIRLKETYDIDLEIWDLNYYKQELVKYHRIVSYFFSEAIADTYCFKKSFRQDKITPLPDFIERSLTMVGLEKTSGSAWSFREQKNLFNLSDLIKENPLVAKHICIIGDAYEGKSELLKKVGYNASLGNGGCELIWIEFKSFTISPVAEILREQYGSWTSVPGINILLMIDGLDEVPTDRFLEAIDHINNFVVANSNINLIFSCRKLFFYQYNLLEKMTNIDFYQIESLSHWDLEGYLIENLGRNQITSFMTAVDKLGIKELVYHPFYLTNLVKWYRSGPNEIPKNKIGIVERFLEESLNVSKSRKLSRGQELAEKRVRYRKVLQRFALYLQIMGVNSTDDDFLQEVFIDSDLELLKHSSLVSRGDKYWAFSNTLFQEQLAALELLALDVELLLEVICVGKKIRKVRTKWIQTIASAISLSEVGSESHRMLIEVVTNDNIELFVLSDGSKFSDAFKLDLLKQIIGIRIKKDSFLITVDERDIAVFLGKNTSGANYLMGVLSGNFSPIVKSVAIGVLMHMKLIGEQSKRYRILLLEQIFLIDDVYYGKTIISELYKCQLSDHSFLNEVIKIPLFAMHEFRNAVYDYITKADLVDQYYQLGLDGIVIVSDHKKISNVIGIERRLETFLLSTKEPKHLRQLYEKIQHDDWMNLYSFSSGSLTSFIMRLGELTITLFYKDPFILITVVKFLRKLQRLSVKDGYSQISGFFKVTKTNLPALLIFLELSDENCYHWEFSNILDGPCIDYLLYAHEEGEIDRNTLDSFYAGMHYLGRIDDAMSFHSKIIDAFGRKDGAYQIANNRYRINEEIKFMNDLKFISSNVSFAEGITAYFTAFGKKSMDYSGLYIDNTGRGKRQQADSTFVSSYISLFSTGNEKIFLKNCLKPLDNPTYFEYVRANLILNFNFKEREGEDKLVKIIEEYFFDGMSNGDFVNTYHWGEDGRIWWHKKEVQMGKIWVTRNINLTDAQALKMLWLDTDGTMGIANNVINKMSSIATKLLQHFSNREHELSKGILENLDEGIMFESVLCSHIGLCGHLMIVEAAPFVLEAILKNKVTHSLHEAIDVYIKLNGDPDNLVEYFESLTDYSDYTYIHLAKILLKDNAGLITDSLLEAIRVPTLGIEHKIDFATQLSTLGNREGFTFLIDHLTKTPGSRERFSFKNEIVTIETRWGMEQIFSQLRSISELKGNYHRPYESAGGFINALVKAFAQKGENDLLIVEEFLALAIAENKNDEDLCRSLDNLIDSLLENSRNAHVKNVGPKQILSFLGDF